MTDSAPEHDHRSHHRRLVVRGWSTSRNLFEPQAQLSPLTPTRIGDPVLSAILTISSLTLSSRTSFRQAFRTDFNGRRLNAYASTCAAHPASARIVCLGQHEHVDLASFECLECGRKNGCFSGARKRCDQLRLRERPGADKHRSALVLLRIPSPLWRETRSNRTCSSSK